MARPGDRGAYEVGNVVIVRNKDNRAERNRNYAMKGKNNPAFGKDYWTTGKKATNARRSKAISAANSKPKSKQTRKRMSKTATGRKRKYLPDGSWTWEYP